MINSESVAMSAVASHAASSGAVPLVAVPLPDVERVWDVRVRTVQAPLSATVKGTRMPKVGSLGRAAGIGANRSMSEVNATYLTATPVQSTVKQQATSATTGVIPGRAWSPPD